MRSISVGFSEIEGVRMRVEYDTITNTNAQFVITNYNLKDYWYASSFRLRRWTWGSWVEVEITEPNHSNRRIYKLEAESSVNVNIYWEPFYGELSPGLYMVVKDVFYGDINELNYEEHELMAWFSISPRILDLFYSNE